jgi:nucleoside-diphosphate-sugar epimerase
MTQCDLLDREAVRVAIEDAMPELVFHLAGIAFVAHDDMDGMYRTNIVGSRNLLSALAELSIPPRGVLMASSANVYGNATEGVLMESVAPAPANDYAISKLAMEMMARTWSDRLPITITRAFNYSGAGQSDRFLLPKIVGSFRRREPVLELGNLDVIRDFSDVRWVVQVYRRLLEAKSAGKTINVCSGTGHSLLELLDLMRSLAEHDPQIKVNPAFVRANEVRVLTGSRALLEGIIGRVEPVPLRDTLEWMLAEN